MARIMFANHPHAETDVKRGTSILRAARTIGAPVGSNCGGVSACSSCHVFVHEGVELLSEMDDEEETIVSMAFQVQEESRLACQAEVVGDGRIVVEISAESLEAWRKDEARRVDSTCESAG